MPLAHAITKYGIEDWTHEILLETNNLKEATDAEIKYIELYGYYNIAKGGNGGDTGRNGEQWKRDKQAESLRKHWAALPQEEKDRRTNASMESKRRNGTLGNNNPHYGKDHGKWTGYWVVKNVRYTTLKEAAEKTNMADKTIGDLCIKKVDRIWIRDSKYIKKGKTPRETGYYRELK